MRSAILLLIQVLFVAGSFGQDEKPQPMTKPPIPYYDWNACPFEGCAYRQWTALKPLTLYDTWKSPRKAIGKVTQGEKVTAETGLVVTLKPGTIQIDRDIPESGLKKGDTVLTYSYRGEGFSAVWFKGNYYPSFDITFAKGPDETGCGGTDCAGSYTDRGVKEWWVRVKLRSGAVGWVEVPLDGEAPFDGMDALALDRALMPMAALRPALSIHSSNR